MIDVQPGPAGQCSLFDADRHPNREADVLMPLKIDWEDPGALQGIKAVLRCERLQQLVLSVRPARLGGGDDALNGGKDGRKLRVRQRGVVFRLALAHSASLHPNGGRRHTAVAGNGREVEIVRPVIGDRSVRRRHEVRSRGGSLVSPPRFEIRSRSAYGGRLLRGRGGAFLSAVRGRLRPAGRLAAPAPAVVNIAGPGQAVCDDIISVCRYVPDAVVILFRRHGISDQDISGPLAVGAFPVVGARDLAGPDLTFFFSGAAAPITRTRWVAVARPAFQLTCSSAFAAGARLRILWDLAVAVSDIGIAVAARASVVTVIAFSSAVFARAFPGTRTVAAVAGHGAGVAADGTVIVSFAAAEAADLQLLRPDRERAGAEEQHGSRQQRRETQIPFHRSPSTQILTIFLSYFPPQRK